MSARRSDLVALSTHNLIAGYERDLPILKGVDFSVRTGEFVVVLGPNGAGKSTLVKAIAGLVPIHSGSVVLSGADVTAVPAHEKVRRGLAFVPQTEHLSPHDPRKPADAANILPQRSGKLRLSAQCFPIWRPDQPIRRGSFPAIAPDAGSRPSAHRRPRS
jgi:branched-chain amino acid transport system ATP-binding protein